MIAGAAPPCSKAQRVPGGSLDRRDQPTRLDDAIAAANSLPMAFQASIFTEDLRTAFDAAERLAASAVMVNDHTAFRTDWMPFAGRRQSGYGIGGIPWTMREMIEQKVIVFRT